MEPKKVYFINQLQISWLLSGGQLCTIKQRRNLKSTILYIRTMFTSRAWEVADCHVPPGKKCLKQRHSYCPLWRFTAYLSSATNSCLWLLHISFPEEIKPLASAHGYLTSTVKMTRLQYTEYGISPKYIIALKASETLA